MDTKDLILLFHECQMPGQDGLWQVQEHFTHLLDIYSPPTMSQVTVLGTWMYKTRSLFWWSQRVADKTDTLTTITQHRKGCCAGVGWGGVFGEHTRSMRCQSLWAPGSSGTIFTKDCVECFLNSFPAWIFCCLSLSFHGNGDIYLAWWGCGWAPAKHTYGSP